MKTKTFLALFCLLCISSGFSSCQRHSSDQWKLVWEDNFDQKTGFDPQVWSKIPRGKSDWNNYMTDFDSSGQIGCCIIGLAVIDDASQHHIAVTHVETGIEVGHIVIPV